jgi:hypothetical protein
VHGAGHFRTPVAKGIEIMEALRGHTSGYAIPTFVVDAPEGGGKVPLLPQYLLSMSEKRVVLRNYEGFITTYTQPIDYQAHDPATCAYCQRREGSLGQAGVAGLLAGEGLTIEPEGWGAVHQRSLPSMSKPTLLDRGSRGNGHKRGVTMASTLPDGLAAREADGGLKIAGGAARPGPGRER